MTARELAATDQLSGRPAVAGQHHKVGVEAVAGLRLGTVEIVARISEQAQLSRAVLEPDRRQVGLAEGHPGDREGVTGVHSGHFA